MYAPTAGIQEAGVNYYNDNDERCCAWLRELIAAGLIPAGEVDGRSICDVKPADLRGYIQCHWFAGIGGWPYALKLAGWPEDRPVWTGSPPCQENSVAGCIWGLRKGLRGNRSGLAITWTSLVAAVQPPIVFFENVPGIAPWLAEIERRLEAAGYIVSRSQRSAADIGAPDLRRRVWLVAHRHSKRLEINWPPRPFPVVGEPWRTTPGGAWAKPNAGIGVLEDGFSERVALVRAFGNAIVPQLAAQFIKAVMEISSLNLKPQPQEKETTTNG